jgi:hypothetical protein
MENIRRNKMATITINLTDEQKDFLNNYAKDNNTNITDLFKLFIEYLENFEDRKEKSW